MNFKFQSSLIVTILLALPLAGCSTFMQHPGTPLAAAAHRGDIAEIRRLVAAGANPNEYDVSNQTPLHWAARGGHPIGSHECREDNERREVVAALIDLGADVNAIDRRAAVPGTTSGWTPLHVALHHGQFKIAELLLERGANPRIRTGQGRTAVAMASDHDAPKALLADLVERQ